MTRRNTSRQEGKHNDKKEKRRQDGIKRKTRRNQ